MPNRNIFNFQPDLVKETVYGLETNQPINNSDEGISITGTINLHEANSLSVNILDVPEISVSNTIPISILGNPGIILTPSVRYTLYSLTFPTSASETIISSDIIQTDPSEEMSIYVYLSGGGGFNRLTASLFVTPIASKDTGILYGLPRVVDSIYSFEGFPRVATLLCEHPSNYMFVTLSGTELSDATIGIYFVKRTY